ncbi:metallophosphoesterase [Saccharothrix sp. MB29]|nr:metallophosphoesterase [Saccharothrix sp. MB29]
MGVTTTGDRPICRSPGQHTRTRTPGRTGVRLRRARDARPRDECDCSSPTSTSTRISGGRPGTGPYTPTRIARDSATHHGTGTSRKADALLCAGDLYEHERFSPDTAQFLRDVFESVDMPVFLAPGNHDWYGPQSLYHQVQWTPNVHLFTEDRFVPRVADGLTLWAPRTARPPTPTGSSSTSGSTAAGQPRPLPRLGERGDGVQESGNCRTRRSPRRRSETAGIDHAFVGHFHTARTPNGTPIRQSGPADLRRVRGPGVVLFTVRDDGTVERERHDVSVSEVHDVEVRLNGVTHSGQVREQVIAAVTGLSRVARVTITGSGAEVDIRPADLDAVAPHLDALVPRLGSITPPTTSPHWRRNRPSGGSSSATSRATRPWMRTPADGS